jgi:hypothetical protein
MSQCVRCHSEVRFFDGFITARGMVCPRCREIESLHKDLASFLAETEVLALLDRITAPAAPLEKIRRLAELDDSTVILRTAVAALAIERGEAAAFPPEILEAARVGLFERRPDPGHIEGLIAIGRASRAAELLEANPPEASDAWVNAAGRLVEQMPSSRVLAIAVAMRGTPGRSHLDLVARTMTDLDGEAVRAWISRTRIASVEHAAGFHGAIANRVRSSDLKESTSDSLLAAFREKWKGTAEELSLLHAVGDRDGLARALAAIESPSADIMACLDRFARAGLTDLVIDALERTARPGPLSQAISAIAEFLAGRPELPASRTPEMSPALRARCAAVMERCGEWKRALALGADNSEDASRTPQALRARCREALATADEERMGRVSIALEQAWKGRYREARTALAAIRDTSPETAPLAARAAGALLLLLESALYESLALVAPALTLLAKQRFNRRKPLKDEGVAARMLPLQRDTFLNAARAFLAADSVPLFPIILPRGFDVTAWNGALEEDARRAARLEEAINVVETDRITESSFLEPAFVRIFGEFVVAAAGGDTAPTDEVCLDRAALYALAARRLNAPADPGGARDASERVAPRELVAEFGLRGFAFRPRETRHDIARWGDFIQVMGGMLQTLGYNANGARIVDETWPCWTKRSPMARPGRTWLESDHLPPLDDAKPLRIEDFFKSVEIDLTRAPQDTGWRK